jgi:radical SAM superfamily enzyme YgiQ (UPF0313 family)
MTSRVVLYNPRAEHWTMPLALLSLASCLDRDRFDPVIIDGRIEDDPVAAVLAHCDDALCLGCTVLSGAPILDALAVTRAVKQRHPDLPVIWGGWHPSVLPESCLEEPAVDIAVQGQGEPVLGEIVERLVEGAPPDGCAGCVTRGPGNEIRRTPARALVNPGSFPPSDYELIDVERYFSLKKRRQLDYVSSIGCRFRCSFCADPTVYGRQWAGLEPGRIGDDLERHWRQWRFDDVSFQDETFFTSRDRVAGVATQLLERGLDCTWAATMRADQGARLPEELLDLCARSGLRRVIVGVESATQEGLERLRKDITLDQVRLSAERCARYGIAAKFPFIVGLPDEPISSVHAALRMAAELRAMDPGFETPFFFYQPYPGTELGAATEAAGHRAPATLVDWAGFDFVDTAAPWVPEEVRLLVEPHTLAAIS